MASTVLTEPPLTYEALELSESRPVSARHIPSLDGLRAVAVLLVLGHHFRVIMEPSHRLEQIGLWMLDGGWAGVELFFVLSGFLITGILLDSKHTQGFFRNFYARRALRIFPLYYAYLVLVFGGLAFWWVRHFHVNPWQGINPLWYLLYLENFKPHHMFYDQFMGHLWSLAIEEQFYLVWPLLLFILNRQWLGFVCSAGVCAALISRLFMAGQTVQGDFFLNTFTLASLDSLCAGALIAMVVRNERLSGRLKPWITSAALISGVLFVLLARSAGSLFLYYVPIDTFGLTFLNVFFAGVIYWLAEGLFHPLQSALSVPFLRAIGRVSYGMYVLHPLVIGLILPKIPAVPAGAPPLPQLLFKLAVMVLLSALTFAAAWISWNFWEKPFLKLKRRFEYRRYERGLKGRPGAPFQVSRTEG